MTLLNDDDNEDRYCYPERDSGMLMQEVLRPLVDQRKQLQVSSGETTWYEGKPNNNNQSRSRGEFERRRKL